MTDGILLLLALVPVAITLAATYLGIRQTRSLRDLTGDSGFLGSVLAATLRPPSQPNAEHLKLHEPMRFFHRRAVKDRTSSTATRRRTRDHSAPAG